MYEILILALLFIFTVNAGVNVFLFWLYHKAHGKEGEAVNRGAEIVLATLAADGRVLPAAVKPDVPQTAFNMEDSDLPYAEDLVADDEEIDPLDMIVSRNEEFADQLANSELNKVMGAMDDVQKEIRT